MSLDLQDTIVALSSAPGPGARAIVRMTGPNAIRAAASVFTSSEIDSSRRRRETGHIEPRGIHSKLPGDLYVWPAPHTYTGQELIEIHTISSPPLVGLLIGQLLNAGCRVAERGEFTMRAFLAGKLDLTQAEAVHGVIESSSRDELRQALAQLAGGVLSPMQKLRDDLLDLLAEVEAGLDFSEEDIRFVEQTELLNRVSKGMAHVTLLQKQLNDRAVDKRAFRVVIVGRPNAGKSSLFNALTRERALVSPQAGTTRDFLSRRLKIDNVLIDLVDTAGRQPADGTIGRQAQELSHAQADTADLLLLCLEAGKPPDEHDHALLEKSAAILAISTKCDLAPCAANLVATSTVTGFGIESLRAMLADRARAHFRPALAPSLSRCRHHVDALLGHLRQAHAAVLYEDPAEVLAVELRSALQELGEMVGTIYTDDLLDRIFSRFCIGK